MNMLITKLILFNIWTIFADDNTETVSISSSCNDKDVDGVYYIKPTETGAIIPVICSGGYTMIDASLNIDDIQTYFTTMYRYGDMFKNIYGTDCSDSGGWRDWFIPANKKTKWRVADECEGCKPGQIFQDNTAV